MEEKITVKRGWHCTIIENHVINSDISCHAKMVYVVLCMYANRDDKTCYPSLKTICKDTSIKSKTTVKKGIDELIEKGFLEVINRKDGKGSNESNLYIVKDYPIPSNDIGQDMTRGRSEDDAPLCQEMTHPISPDGHELKPINKSQKNNITEEEPQSKKKYSSEIKEISMYLKDKLVTNGVKVFPRDWHLKNYSIIKRFLGTMTKEEVIKAIDWGLEHKYWKDKIDGMQTVNNYLPKYQLQNKSNGDDWRLCDAK